MKANQKFEKLKKLLSKCSANTKKSAITLAIGEPKHQTPSFITKELELNISNISIYPTTRGSNELRTAIINWLCKCKIPRIKHKYVF